MKVLIVEPVADLGALWKRHLDRQGATTAIALNEDSAVSMLQEQLFDLLILDLELEGGSALAVADFANFRQPDAQIIFVTSSSFFSDGSIFNLCSNACALIQSDTAPDDIAAMAEHYTRTTNRKTLSSPS